MNRLVVLSALSCLLACQPTMTEEGPPRWVGTVEGTDALIAVAIEEGVVVAYVCGKDSWQTRTGWFATSLADEGTGEEGAVLAAQSASGHTLEAALIERQRVTGSIRFADGVTARFTAERADPSKGAGLYDTTSSEGQAGLIVTNDGQSAGAASSIDPDTLDVNRAQVTVNGALSSATAVGGVRVTIPNLTATTLTPIVPTQQSVTGSSPLLFILAHGMSHPIDSELALVDTPFYSRGEWSVDFLRGLLGAEPGAANQLFTFNRPFEDGEYRDVGASFPATLAEADIAANTAIPANFVTLVPVDPRPPTINNLARPAPPVSLFITYRDAPGGLMQSGQRVANQAYLALRWYELRFKRTPRVVFVTQSFGGLATRFVLSTPTNAELTAAQVPFDGAVLSAEDTRRSVYLRDRTMSVVTLGTPHQGSFLADLGVPIQTSVQDALRGVRGQVGNGSAAERFGQQLRVAANFFPQLDGIALTTQQVQQTSEDALNELLRRVNGRALRDLRHTFLATVNQGPLHPRRARRASSPILNGSNTLIPIYAAGSRSPGGRAFDAPELSAFSRYQAEGETERRWITLTMAADLGVRLARAQGYGSSTTSVLAPFDERLDRRRRIVDLGAFVRERAQTAASNLSPWVVENQGVTTAIDATTRLALGPAQGLSLPIYLSKEGQFQLTGTVRVPALGFQCTDGGRTFRLVLDFGRLLTALVATYGSLTQAGTAAGDVDLNGLLAALNLTASNVDDIKDWFLQKYAVLQVSDGRCRLPNDVSIGSLLSVTNLGNWRVVRATDTFPAPVWVRSNTIAQDDEIDTDGAVAFDSAVGLTLGTTTANFFDHTRPDDVRNGVALNGSWYRFFDSPIEPDCHGMQHQFVAGEWVKDTFGPAGPIPRVNGLGSFTP